MITAIFDLVENDIAALAIIERKRFIPTVFIITLINKRSTSTVIGTNAWNKLIPSVQFDWPDIIDKNVYRDSVIAIGRLDPTGQ